MTREPHGSPEDPRAASPLSPRAERFLREELPSRIAHALRGPLGVITGVLAELRSTGTGGDAAALLDLADRSSRRIERIGERLSLLARLERGEPIERQPTALDRVVADAIELVTTTRQRRRVEVSHTLASFVGEGDRALLRLAVAEVVDNGVRFARSRVSVVVPNDRPEVRVRHDGPAFEGETETLFEAYVPHVDKSGLGIGLFLAREILRLHGGHIRVDDDLEGQSFVLTLPAFAPTPAP